MYTTHGHHIPGTDTVNPPKERARCSGAGGCPVCSSEIARAAGVHTTFGAALYGAQPGVTERSYRERDDREIGNPVNHFELAKDAVRRYIEEHNVSGHDLPKFGLYVPLFAYVLGSWKATVSTDTDDVLPGAYFEVTHKAATGETYVKHYEAVRSVTYTD